MSQKPPHKKSLGKLFEKFEELSPNEVEIALEKLLSIRASQRAPALGKKETALLQQINDGLTQEELEELSQLIARREAEEISDPELQRLIHLTEKMEQLNVERMQLIAELSSIRNVSIRDLIKELDIRAA
ncbi:MAG: hypothetical protein R8P61_18180 [Bacteroidia bacterium]|nr:hypothetical protein [Bacteroidia bacterium]